MNMQNQIPKNWQKVKLGEVADFQNGFAFSSGVFVAKSDNAIPVFKMGNIKEWGGIQWTGKEDYIPETQARNLSRFITEPNDILMCMTDMKANVRLLGYSAYIKNERFLINQRVGRIKAKKGLVEPRFLYYYLNSRSYVEYIRSTARSGVQVNLSTEEIKESSVFLPPLTEQAMLAKILSSFDDKIEMNNKIAKTLEEITQAIFKEWFVNFRFPRHEKIRFVESELGQIPKGWKVELIKDLGKVVTGKTPSTENKENFGSEYPFITIPDITGTFITKTERLLSQNGAAKMKNLLLPEGSICVSCIATVGLVGITTEKSFTNQQINTLIPNEEKYTYYLYHFFKNKKKDLELFGSGGTATLIVNKTKFENLDLVIPDRKIMDDFYSLVKPFYEKVLVIIKENQKLAALRDLLLPKLMRGEIKI